MKQKIKLSVLVPAFNEEGNIVNLLKSILKQKRDNYILEQIVVVSDASTDKTNLLVKRMKNKKIKLVVNKKRRGKNGIINDFFKSFKGKYLVQIDADNMLIGNIVINKIAALLEQDFDLVCGYHKPTKPKTTVEKLAFFGVDVWEYAKSKTDKNTERYWCIGQLRGFSAKFIKKFRLPEKEYAIEDVHSFYFAKANKMKISYAKDALVYFKLPDTLNDYTKQMKRFLKTDEAISRFFPKKLVEQYNTLTPMDKFSSLFYKSLSNPIYGVGYFLLQMYTKLSAVFYKQKVVWDTSISTRKIS